MVLDSEALNKARSAAERLTEAEQVVLALRADYHTAIRRLHLAGASLRELADALGLSHQRVSQIVSDEGGTWWSRVWGSRNARDAVCSFCGRAASTPAGLIAGPKVFICHACVQRAERGLAGKSTGLVAAKPGARCGFCRRKAETTRKAGRDPVRVAAAASERPGAASASGGARICQECLALCREILKDRSA